MDHVLTLIAAPQAELAPATIAAVRTALDRLGADSAAARWLSPDHACDIDFALLAPEQAEAAARSVLGNVPVDVAAQPTAGRRKRLLVADMDSTIIIGETLDELAAAAGIGERIAAITARAMNGEIDFPTALRERLAMLEGLDVAMLDRVSAGMRLTPGARRLVATMRANGARTILVSGGFTHFTRRVAELCGFDAHHGNTLEINNGVLTGRPVDPILDANAKLAILTAEAAEHKIPMHEALAVGDGANDLGMISAAGLGVAFHAKPVVATRARVRIDHGDLTSLLYLQGYSDRDFRE